MNCRCRDAHDRVCRVRGAWRAPPAAPVGQESPGCVVRQGTRGADFSTDHRPSARWLFLTKGEDHDGLATLRPADGIAFALLLSAAARRRTIRREIFRTSRFASSSATPPAGATTSSRGWSAPRWPRGWASPSSSRTSPAPSPSLRPNTSPRPRLTATRYSWASGPMTMNPATYSSLPYSPVRDFVPVSMIGSFPLILVVSPSLPVQSMKDLLEYAKARRTTSTTPPAPALPVCERVVEPEGRYEIHIDPLQGSGDSVNAVCRTSDHDITDPRRWWARSRAQGARLAITSAVRHPGVSGYSDHGRGGNVRHGNHHMDGLCSAQTPAASSRSFRKSGARGPASGNPRPLRHHEVDPVEALPKNSAPGRVG